MLFSAQGLMIIAVIALLLFGPEKLPQMARTFGRFMAEFKRAQEAVEATIRAEMNNVPGVGGAAPTAAAAVTPIARASSEEDDEEEDEE